MSGRKDWIHRVNMNACIHRHAQTFRFQELDQELNDLRRMRTSQGVLEFVELLINTCSAEERLFVLVVETQCCSECVTEWMQKPSKQSKAKQSKAKQSKAKQSKAK